MYDGGASPDVINEFINTIIPCESKWDKEVVNPITEAKGLAQFLDSTWTSVSKSTGYTNWRNPYHQGFNSAWLYEHEGRGQWEC